MARVRFSVFAQLIQSSKSISGRRVAFVPDEKNTYGYFTVREMLAFTRPFYSDWDHALELELVEQWQLPLDRHGRNLSKGMKSKTALLLALSRRPELLILDEPTDGLDPLAIEQLHDHLRRKASSGVSIFFSSHHIGEVEAVAERVLLLNKGRLAFEKSIEEIRRDGGLRSAFLSAAGSAR